MAKNSQEYWNERARQDKIKVIKTAEYGVDNLKKLLKKNLDSVEKQIADFYKKYGDEGKYAESLSYAEFQKYKAKLRLKAKQNPQDKTLQRLARQDIPKYRIDRLRALQTDLQIQLTEATRGQEAGIYKTLKDVAKVSQATTALRFKKTLDVAFDKIASRKLEKILSSDWVGNMNWSERLWKDRELVGKKVTEILETGLPQGKSMQDMARDLKEATNSSFNDAFRLIRTESAHLDGEVLLESFKQAKAELGYTKYIFDATIDNRTSKICAEKDNKSYLIDEAVIGENFPPLHPNCRSTAVLDENSIDESVIEDSKQEEKEEETQEKEQEKQQEQTTEKTSTVEKVEKGEVLKALEESNIERLPFEEFKQMPTVDEIIERVGGGDMTKGSCSSLAFCYAGNRGKYKVLDFRDGASREFFSKNGNILKIANLEGVESLIEKEYNDFVAVNKLLYYTVKNKEYYLSTGQHAAIIRRLDKGFEYLELQSATDNGFKKLTKDVLKKRFKCQKSHTISGIKAKMSSALIDIETLAKNAEFKEMLEYINTDIKKQKKGIKGFAK